jgi:hypothetical protein
MLKRCEVLYLGNVIDVLGSTMYGLYMNKDDIITVDGANYFVADKIFDFKKNVLQIIVNRG